MERAGDTIAAFVGPRSADRDALVAVVAFRMYRTATEQQIATIGPRSGNDHAHRTLAFRVVYASDGGITVIAAALVGEDAGIVDAGKAVRGAAVESIALISSGAGNGDARIIAAPQVRR